MSARATLRPEPGRRRYDRDSQYMSCAHEARWTEVGTRWMGDVLIVDVVDGGPGSRWGRRPKPLLSGPLVPVWTQA